MKAKKKSHSTTAPAESKRDGEAPRASEYLVCEIRDKKTAIIVFFRGSKAFRQLDGLGRRTGIITARGLLFLPDQERWEPGYIHFREDAALPVTFEHSAYASAWIAAGIKIGERYVTADAQPNLKGAVLKLSRKRKHDVSQSERLWRMWRAWREGGSVGTFKSFAKFRNESDEDAARKILGRIGLSLK